MKKFLMTLLVLMMCAIALPNSVHAEETDKYVLRIGSYSIVDETTQEEFYLDYKYEYSTSTQRISATYKNDVDDTHEYKDPLPISNLSVDFEPSTETFVLTLSGNVKLQGILKENRPAFIYSENANIQIEGNGLLELVLTSKPKEPAPEFQSATNTAKAYIETKGSMSIIGIGDNRIDVVLDSDIPENYEIPSGSVISGIKARDFKIINANIDSSLKNNLFCSTYDSTNIPEEEHVQPKNGLEPNKYEVMLIENADIKYKNIQYNSQDQSLASAISFFLFAEETNTNNTSFNVKDSSIKIKLSDFEIINPEENSSNVLGKERPLAVINLSRNSEFLINHSSIDYSSDIGIPFCEVEKVCIGNDSEIKCIQTNESLLFATSIFELTDSMFNFQTTGQMFETLPEEGTESMTIIKSHVIIKETNDKYQGKMEIIPPTSSIPSNKNTFPSIFPKASPVSSRAVNAEKQNSPYWTINIETKGNSILKTPKNDNKEDIYAFIINENDVHSFNFKNGENDPDLLYWPYFELSPIYDPTPSSRHEVLNTGIN